MRIALGTIEVPDEWRRAIATYYGVDGQPTGGTYDRLTDEMLAEYAAAMPLILTRGD